MSEGFLKRRKNGAFDTTDPSTKIFKFNVAGLFGQRSPSKLFMTIPNGRRSVHQAMSSVINKLQSGEKSAKLLVKKISENNFGKGALKLLEVVDFLDNISDFSQLVVDPLLYGKFPDVNELISPSELRNVNKFSIDRQCEAVNQFNLEANTLNTRHLTMTTLQKDSDYDYPYGHAKYPMITGPLDVLDSENARGDPYYVQTRVQTEIDSIRELMLRNPMSPFFNTCKAALEKQGYIYSDLLADTSNVSIVSIIDSEGYSQSDWDDLYRYAFTAVCVKNNGVVYEDLYPAQKDSAGTVIIAEHARFQCGYKDSNACKVAGNLWYNSPVEQVLSNYGEWYAFSELNTILGSLNRPLINNITTYTATTQNGKPASATQASSACIVSNSGVRTMCDDQDLGFYNPDTHVCRFSPQYCQKLGTCFDNSTGACYLPNSPGFQTAEAFFGQGGTREWISVRGCNFASGKPDVIAAQVLFDVSPLGFFTSGFGGNLVNDMFRNHKNWNEGMKQTMKEPMNQLTVAAMALTPLMSFSTAGGIITMAAVTLAMVGLIVQGILDDRVERGLHVPYATEDDKSNAIAEYTCTGWQRNITDPFGDMFTLGTTGLKIAKQTTFVDGWVTKPLLAKSGPYYNSASASTISQINGTRTDTFFSDRDTRCINYAKTLLQGSSIGDVIRRFLELPGNYDAVWNNGLITTRTYIDPKKLCSDLSPPMWRSGSRSSANLLWCLPEQPPQTLADPSIGPLARMIAIELSVGAAVFTRTVTTSISYTVTGVTVKDPSVNLVDGLFFTPSPFQNSSRAIIRNPVSNGATPPVWSFSLQVQDPNTGFRTPYPAGTQFWAEIAESELAKNRIWTDGTDPTAPNFPAAAGPGPDTRSDRTNDIYYQLVYDKSIFAPVCQCSTGVKDDTNKQCIVPIQGFTPLNGTCSASQTQIGTSCVSCPSSYELSSGTGTGFTNVDIPGYASVSLGCTKSCMSLPSLLFNDSALSKHFSLFMINNARRTMCQEQLMYDPRTVDAKCWGYLSIGFTGYNFSPMTVPATRSTASSGLTCDPGRYKSGNTCVNCPDPLPAGAAWSNPGVDCSTVFVSFS
jgi:hypothetical protein